MKSIRIMKSAGKIILDYLYKKDITQADVAKMVNETPQNFGRKLRSSDMTVGMVVKISKALSHNFFEDIGNEWKRETFNIQNVINEPVGPLQP
jgi:hypothetical protein